MQELNFPVWRCPECGFYNDREVVSCPMCSFPQPDTESYLDLEYEEEYDRV